jgi:hypothetical protein
VVEVSYIIRLTLLVRDKGGRQVPVYLYTDDRGKEPAVCGVQPGHTVAILYAHQHSFMDMSVGIRQEDIGTIKVVPTISLRLSWKWTKIG